MGNKGGQASIITSPAILPFINLKKYGKKRTDSQFSNIQKWNARNNRYKNLGPSFSTNNLRSLSNSTPDTLNKMTLRHDFLKPRKHSFINFPALKRSQKKL